jgi:NADH-quinone oxidoreductase subunit A
MNSILLSPPVAFLIVLAGVILFSAIMSRLSLRQPKPDKGSGKSYACGEDIQTSLMQPDYSQFFPFAFFFTVLHVVTLMIATVPVGSTGSYAIALIYLAGTVIGLLMLFRR